MICNIFKNIRKVEVPDDAQLVKVVVAQVDPWTELTHKDKMALKYSITKVTFPNEKYVIGPNITYLQVDLPILKDPESGEGFAFEDPQFIEVITTLMSKIYFLEEELAELKKKKSNIIIPGRD